MINKLLLPKYGLIAIFLGVYSLDWLSRVLGILPNQVRWIPEGLIVLLVIYTVLLRSFKDKLIFKRTPIDIFMVGLVLIGLLSLAVNYGSIITALSGFRNLLRPLLLFYVIVNLELDEKYLKRLIFLLIFLELLQIPITFVQFLLYGGGDQANGTLGYYSSQMTVMLASVFMSLLFGLAIVRKSWMYAFVGSLLFFPILFTEGKAGFFIVPLMLLFMFGVHFLQTAKPGLIFSKLKYVIGIIIVFSLIYGLSLWLAPLVIPRSEINTFLQEPSEIFERYETPLSQTNGIPLSRLGDIQFAWNLISQTPLYTIMGYGPGEASPGIQGWEDGKLYVQYGLDPAFFFGDINAQYTLYSFTQVSAMLQEFGVTGLIFYLLMLVAIFRTSIKFARQPGVTSFWQGINLGFSGAVFAFTAYAVYYRAWYWEASAYVFWGLAAVIYTLYSRNKPSWTTNMGQRGLPND